MNDDQYTLFKHMIEFWGWEEEQREIEAGIVWEEKIDWVIFDDHWMQVTTYLDKSTVDKRVWKAKMAECIDFSVIEENREKLKEKYEKSDLVSDCVI